VTVCPYVPVSHGRGFRPSARFSSERRTRGSSSARGPPIPPLVTICGPPLPIQAEWVVGGTSAPLGIYAAVPSPERCEVVVIPPRWEEYRTVNLAPYDPGPDLLELTGHLPDIADGGLRRVQLRAILPYCKRPLLLSSEREVYLHLLEDACPRRRIRSLIRLRAAGFVSRASLLRLYPRP